MATYTWTVRTACALALLLSSPAWAVDAVLRTESWPQSDSGFAQFQQRIQRFRGRNLLARQEAKFVDTGQLAHGQPQMLVDGSAGVRLGDGRVGINGQPAVLSFYLGGPRVISQVGLFTFNSDARANQDFEVRFANHAETPGVKPEFPEAPHLTTGPTILGANTGGFHTSFRARETGALYPDKADWVQFRIWRTYNQPAGAPAKDKNTADGWTAVIEIEVLGDDQDIIEIPEDDIERSQVAAQRALDGAYRPLATWQDTMLTVREAMAQAEPPPAAAAAFQPYTSSLLRGGQDPEPVRVDVTGLKRLWLEADVGGDGYSSDQAVWGDPVLVDKDGKATPLTTLQPAFAKVGSGDLVVDKDHWQKPLQVGQRRFERGLWAHAPSQLCYELDGRYVRFEAWVGIGVAAGGNGSSQFRALQLPSVPAGVDGLWTRLANDFGDPGPRREMAWEKEDWIWAEPWPVADRKTLSGRYAKACHRSEALAQEAQRLAASATDDAGLRQIRGLYHRSRRLREALTAAEALPLRSLRLAVQDLVTTCGERYRNGPAYLERVNAAETDLAAATQQAAAGAEADVERLEQLVAQTAALQREALLANPLIDFERLLLVRRKADNLGLPANWQSNCALSKTGFADTLVLLEMKDLAGPLTTVYAPDGGRFVGDVDLHFGAGRLLFSAVGSNDRWHVFEINVDGTGLRQVTPADPPDVDYYDPCYLPDEDIIVCSTANFVGVPCVSGSTHVAMLYRLKRDGSGIRQLCFEQDHDWCPTMLPNGRVLYARWEYTDTPHSQTRMLFHMNPDGTDQKEYYGSNSQWPNAIFYARPVPGSATRAVGIVSGHHGDARMGELVLFDTALGRHEAGGVVQRIPGYGQRVEPVIRDSLTSGVYPKFLHPFPLSEKHFLVACQPTSQSRWGLYLVDVFDNMVLLREEPGHVLFEPVPLRATPRPPVMTNRVLLDRTDALVQMTDVYAGPGLAGVPRGTVKALRLFTYHFAYHNMGGLLGVVGIDGPWDIKRILGTVPVEPDGSALFRVPANTPISIQPLDADGKALQLMRSWMTAMPGEVLSCVGCHEPQNSTAVNRRTTAVAKPPAAIQPWYGPARGFSFAREVQPVLDTYCIACHDGGKAMDLRGGEMVKDFSMVCPGNGAGSGHFSVSYANLHGFVRRPGIESDYHLLTPAEFHADTTELVQLLQASHHGVRLEREAWDRLVTWIDLNAPFHSTWGEYIADPGPQRQRRRELRQLYAGIDEDPEADVAFKPADLGPPVAPTPAAAAAGGVPPSADAWPFDAPEARRRQAAAGPAVTRSVDLGEGVTMTLVLIPAGDAVLGEAGAGGLRLARIAQPLWMSQCEVSNQLYARFDPLHDSHVESKNHYQFGVHGYPANEPTQPVVRVSWTRAMDFCRWLSERAGMPFTLPTEEQWEYACRAGAGTPFAFGDLLADYSTFANLADAKLSEYASNPYTVFEPLANATKYDDYIPKDTRFNDGGLVSRPVGSYQPNAWGLHDMHGNVWEWTLTAENDRQVVRGGSWYDRPPRCTAAFRLAYPAWQRVFNVGFRVVCGVTPGM